MANLLELLGIGATAATGAKAAQLEGQAIGDQKRQADLLAQIKQEQEAADRAQRAQMNALQMRNIESQMRERDTPEPVKPLAPVYDRERGGFADPNTQTFQPLAGIPADTVGQYEERPERGGVAIYENGKFKTWKLRPPQERDTSFGDALAANRAFQREQALRQDFQQEPVIKQAGALASAVAQLRASAAEKTPQGDLNMLYGAVKLRDPNAVREGELALNNKARSANTQLFAMFDRVKEGRILTDMEREQIMSLVDQMVAQQSSLIRPIQKTFGEKSRQYGADSSFVARDPFEGVRSPLSDFLPLLEKAP